MGIGVIQIAPQMRILVAIEPVDGRKGIDSLARLCQDKLRADPFSGCLFVFRSRRGTSIRILVYDGQAGAETAVAGTIRVVAERQRAFPGAPGASGTVAVGGGQPGNRSRAGVAKSKLRQPPTKGLRSAFISGMLRLWRKRKRGAIAGKRSTVSRLLS